MMGEQVGKFLNACKAPSKAHDIIRAVFSDGLSDLESFYALKCHCLERGLVSAERTPEGFLRYSLTERGRKNLEICESVLAYIEAAEKSLTAQYESFKIVETFKARTNYNVLWDAFVDDAYQSLSPADVTQADCAFCKFIERDTDGLDEEDEGIYLIHLRNMHGLTA